MAGESIQRYSFKYIFEKATSFSFAKFNKRKKIEYL